MRKSKIKEKIVPDEASTSSKYFPFAKNGYLCRRKLFAKYKIKKKS